MSDEEPPNTNEIAEALWKRAQSPVTLGELLELAKVRSGGTRIAAMKAFRDTFDISFGEAKMIVGNWAGLSDEGVGQSSSQLESQFGGRVRDAIRPRPLRTRWVKCEDGGWMGYAEDDDRR